MTVSVKLREKVFERAAGICEYCRSNSEFSQDPFDVEHIVPLTKNGKTVARNLALSCHGCNLHKSKKIAGFDALSGDAARLFNPRKDDWDEHFAWANDFSIVVGLTPIGRATIEALKLNRQGLINQRTILRNAELHPPTILKTGKRI